MLFLQLTLTEDALSFQHCKWIERMMQLHPDAQFMELDNHSELYLFQQVLKWIQDAKAPLVIHVVSYFSEAQTGSMLRFLQEVLQKNKPVLITFQGEHDVLKKYIRAFAPFTEVESEEEAAGKLSELPK